MAIDESKIVDAVVGMNPHGNDEGIIDAFGVYLTNHYADYYNKISYNFEKEITRLNKEDLDFLVALLKTSGHSCAFHTFGGIYRSNEWKGLIAPMCKSKEDEVKGVVAVVNALGWGVWKVKSVTSAKLVLQVENSYESTGFLGNFGKSKQSECYLVTGGAAGLMDLIYTKNPDEKGIDSGYDAVETKCRSKGDKCCEVVVTVKKK